MEQMVVCNCVGSSWSFGFGVGVVIFMLLKCFLFLGDPFYCLKCHIHQIFLGCMLLYKDEAMNGNSSSISPMASPSYDCGKPVDNPKPLRDELSRKEVENVMEELGITSTFGTNPEGSRGSLVGAWEIEHMFEEQEPSLGEVKEAFDVFDKNGDGFIDAGELKAVLWALGLREVSPAYCQRLITTFDENKDGRIDFREFTKLVEKSLCPQ